MSTIITRLNTDIDTGIGSFINDTFGALSTATQPLFHAMFVLFIMLYGISLYWGYHKATMGDAFKHIFVAVLIWAMLTDYGNFFYPNIVKPLFETPNDIAGVIIGAQPTGGASAASLSSYLDGIWDKYDSVASLGKGYIMKHIISLIIFLSAIISVGYGVILISIAKIALAVLLGLAPIFVITLLFKSTSKFFEAWLQKTVNYMLVPILTYGTLLIPVKVIDIKLTSVIANSGDVTMAHAGFILLVSLLCFIVLMQVMQMAAGLSGGLSY